MTNNHLVNAIMPYQLQGINLSKSELDRHKLGKAVVKLVYLAIISLTGTAEEILHKSTI
jgi:hypothetical protein